jgi:hypothetical protein
MQESRKKAARAADALLFAFFSCLPAFLIGFLKARSARWRNAISGRFGCLTINKMFLSPVAPPGLDRDAIDL